MDKFKTQSPTKIILDTDIGNDIDNALALGMLHALESRGECKLLAVVVNKANKFAPQFVDVINTFYGRGNIPIGWLGEDGPTPEEKNFIKPISQAADIYARTYIDNNFQSPVELYRKTLAAQEDNSIVIISIGFLTNIAALLDSGPCIHSPLGGIELVARKVRFLSIMAGNFSDEALAVPSDKFKEYNIYNDIASAQKVISEWPVPAVFCGFELGVSITYPAESIINDYKWTSNHPIADGYRLYNCMPYSRPCWDLVSSIFAIRPDNGYFSISHPGRVIVFDEGHNGFIPDSLGLHYYLSADSMQCKVLRELFAGLCSQPI